MRKFVSESFWDGFLGAGLFARVRLPDQPLDTPQSRTYAFTLRVCSLISLAVMLLGFVFLRRSGHEADSYSLLAFAILWLTVGFLRSRDRQPRD